MTKDKLIKCFKYLKMTESYLFNNNANSVQTDMHIRKSNDNIFSNKTDPYRSDSKNFRTPKKIYNNSHRNVVNNMRTINKVNLGERIESEQNFYTPQRGNYNQKDSMNNTRYRNTPG